jgi:hypothetical protein
VLGARGCESDEEIGWKLKVEKHIEPVRQR